MHSNGIAPSKGPRGHTENNGKTHREAALHFLLGIWEGSEGYGFMAAKKASTGRWIELPIDLRQADKAVRESLETYSRELYDLYFCPNTFTRPKRTAEYAHKTRWGWCDIDAADPARFRPRASILLRTSPGRYQGLWLWDKCEPPRLAEGYSHALTYRHGGDAGGWSITKYLRLPYTYNHKPHYDRPLVKILRNSDKPTTDRPVLIKGVNLAAASRPKSRPKPDAAIIYTEHDASKVVAKYRSKLHAKTVALLTCKRMIERDRSKQIYMIVANLFEAGASKDEIGACLWVSPYFISKYGDDERALAAEINRIIGKLVASGK